ncbi:MAG: G/U mismatch-specific DNA glycosylase, partial [Acidimicrobiales bacterium]
MTAGARRPPKSADHPVPDILGPALSVLFCGINPGLTSAELGQHFARAGNRFWKALHLSGFTDRQLAPSEQDLLPSYGLGITNLVHRASAAAAELTSDELRRGAAELEAVVAGERPSVLAVVGMQAYRTAFGRPKAGIGLQQEALAGVPVWVLPNTSGLQARYQLPELVELFGELRRWVAERRPGG